MNRPDQDNHSESVSSKRLSPKDADDDGGACAKKAKKKQETDSDEDNDDQDRKWDRQQRSIMNQWDIADIAAVIPEQMRPATLTDLINYPGARRGAILTALYDLAKATRGQYKHVVEALEESLRNRGGRTLSREDIRSAFSKLVHGVKQHGSSPVSVPAISQGKAHGNAARHRQRQPTHQQPSARIQPPARGRPIARLPRRPAHATTSRNPRLLRPIKADNEASLELRDAIHALHTAETAYNLARDDRALAYFERDETGVNLLNHNRNVTAAEQEVNFAHARVESNRRLLKAGGGEEESDEDGEVHVHDSDGH